ncbi:DNA-directed RNA polymerase V subunit 1 [Dorcoceras hygrometricum]|uniref:DNA-directed RNA polymerase V subunit 1 n=1 Tax=Dorcoceras hygrometricum TaxID=472368 RepID=A0A2Z7A4D3_9LAMI|nr:DNA-directed RNA polymerase V subunit 1 [Dorcoceras hygrometricum]
MSLFDLQDVCIAIGSLATLDLPMVVDLIGIYGLKGPYSTRTTTDWFLQALSVIPRGSWGDVARRFTMIRWCSLTKESRIWSWTGLAYLPQSTEKRRVLETPVGARHKCQRDRKNKIREITTGPPPHAAAPPIARMNARETRAGRAKGANAGRNSMRDDGWTCASGCANGRSTLTDGCARLSRRPAHALPSTMRDGWPITARCFARSGRPLLQRWASPPHAGAAMCGQRWRNVGRWLRALSAQDFLVVAAPPPAGAPVNFRRCRDGWSEFF